jgi:hypothetical protein
VGKARPKAAPLLEYRCTPAESVRIPALIGNGRAALRYAGPIAAFQRPFEGAGHRVALTFLSSGGTCQIKKDARLDVVFEGNGTRPPV